MISLSFVIFYGFCKNRSKVKLTYAIAAVAARFISRNKLKTLIPIGSLVLIAAYLCLAFRMAMIFYSFGTP